MNRPCHGCINNASTSHLALPSTAQAGGSIRGADDLRRSIAAHDQERIIVRTSFCDWSSGPGSLERRAAAPRSDSARARRSPALRRTSRARPYPFSQPASILAVLSSFPFRLSPLSLAQNGLADHQRTSCRAADVPGSFPERKGPRLTGRPSASLLARDLPRIDPFERRACFFSSGLSHTRL
jgi:hypothetical protein